MIVQSLSNNNVGLQPILKKSRPSKALSELPPRETKQNTGMALTSEHYKALFMPVRAQKIPFGRNLREGEDNHLNYLGAQYLGKKQAVFRVYGPDVKEMSVQVSKTPTTLKYYDAKTPSDMREAQMTKINEAVFEVKLDKVEPGDMYRFKLIKEGETEPLYRKDPRSFCQPNDTLGWSAVFDHNAYQWEDADWLSGKDSRKMVHKGGIDEVGAPPTMILEEMHIGVLEGFEKAKKELAKIAEEGVCNTVLVMPVGEFFGQYNLGYEDSDKFAPESAFGKPDEFKSFVDYAHQKGINVILDVVPNHFGPQGTVIQDYGEVFAKENNLWGRSLDFGHKHINNYMIDMMLHWLTNFHLDGLRIDAVHEIHPEKALKEMACELRNHKETKGAILIPESMDKSRKLTRALSAEEVEDPLKTAQRFESDPSIQKNFGFDMQYIFDFRNTLMALMSGWQIYDCPPSIKDLETEFKQGHRYFTDPEATDAFKANSALVYTVSHDELQTFGGLRNIPRLTAIKLGLVKENRLETPDGLDKKPFRDTLTLLKSYISDQPEAFEKSLSDLGVNKQQFLEAYKEAQSLNRLALGALFMHPSQKMLFMGDQRGELAPFNFNSSIEDHVIYQGSEEKYQGWKLVDVLKDQKGITLGKPAQRESILNQPEFTDKTLQEQTLRFTKALKQLINENQALQNGSFDHLITHVYEDKNALQVHRYEDGNEIIAVMNFSNEDYESFNLENIPHGKWEKVLDSNNPRFGGPGEDSQAPISREHNAIKLPKESIVVFKKTS